MVAAQSRGRSGWRAVHDVGGRRAVVVRTKAIGGGRAMQEKEMTQEELIRRQRELINRLDKELREDAAEIATLRKTISEQAATIRNLEISFGKMTEMAARDGDTIREQEATIRHLRTELCNASAVAMENREMALKLKRSACDTFVQLRDLRETIAKLRY